MATKPTGADRRAQRTRHAIRQAAIAVARERGLGAASGREITERANVSRGTFYAHCADKDALIAAIARQDYRRRVAPLSPTSVWDDQALRLLNRHTLEYVQDVYLTHASPHHSPEVGALIARIVIDEVRTLLAASLDQNRRGIGAQDAPTETVATAMAWAIYGTAVHWGQQPDGRSLAQTVDDLFRIVVRAVAPAR